MSLSDGMASRPKAGPFGKPKVALRDKRPYIALGWKEEGTPTMTLTLELSPEREAALKAQAQARGMSIEEWLLDLTKQTRPAAARSLQDELTPKEWVRQFNAWVEGHDRTAPPLSDEAIGRESIYPDRF
jgi:hypothetical protein